MEGQNYSNILKLKRSAVESNLQFLGFIIFENKLKPGTIPVIKTLNQARIRQVMCTGDNLLTAISVSRECGLVDVNRRIFVPRFESGTHTDEDARIAWHDVDDPTSMINSVTFKVHKIFLF